MGGVHTWLLRGVMVMIRTEVLGHMQCSWQCMLRLIEPTCLLVDKFRVPPLLAVFTGRTAISMMTKCWQSCTNCSRFIMWRMMKTCSGTLERNTIVN